MRIMLYALIGLFLILVLGALWWRWTSRRRQLPCPAWLAWFLENPFVEFIAGAQTTLDRIGLQTGEQGLDVGCGPGRLSIPAAMRVGPTGSITALDVQPAMLACLRKAMVADLVRPDQRGRAYGVYHAVVGLTVFPASLIAGVPWQGIGDWSGFGPAAPFLFGAAMALVAGILLVVWEGA